MKKFMVVLITSAAFFSTAVFADDATVATPGVQIHTDANGTSVVTPGMQVQSSANGSASVVTPPVPVVPQTAASVLSAAPAAPSSYANATLEGMDFSSQNLTGADFSNANLTGARFTNANLANANFSNASLENADLSKANLTGAHLPNANLSGANLSDADLSKADLTNANFDHALVVNTRMVGAVLTNADMTKAVHQAMPRPAFVDAGAIGKALASPTKKIDLTINFDFNSDKLSNAGARQLKEIADALNTANLKNVRILVEGHTDSIGSDTYNKDLSYRRATRIVRDLTDEYSVPAMRLSAEGFGKTRPVASNDSDLGRAMNRRVTLVNLGG